LKISELKPIRVVNTGVEVVLKETGVRIKHREWI